MKTRFKVLLPLLLLSVLPAAVQAQFTFTTNSGTITITGYSGSGSAVTIPSTINGYLVIVEEACTNLANPIWSPVSTNTLTGGSSYFSDPQWTNFPARFYRLRSP